METIQILQVAWIRYDTRTILTMQDKTVTQSSHYSLENKRDSSDLIITNIKEDDAGIYICQINSEPMRNHVMCLILSILVLTSTQKSRNIIY